MSSAGRNILVVAVAALALASCASRNKSTAPSYADPAPFAQQPVDRGEPPARQDSGSASAERPADPGLAAMQAQFAAAAGDRVFFELDSYNLSAEARDILQRQAAWLRSNPNVRVLIAGNCDERGTREYNFALGARRAQAASDFLVAQGVALSRISTVSYGKERPLDPASSEAAWSRNRNSHTVISDLGLR